MADIFYRLTANYSYKGANCNNVWHYKTVLEDSPSASELVNLFDTEWTNALKAILNVICTINSYYALRTTDLGDYAALPINETGSVGTSATAMPPQYASCITATTTGSAIRHAYKRFPGVDEAMMQQGDLATAFVAAFDVINAKMLATLAGATADYVPVAVRYNTSSPPAIISYATLTLSNFRRFNTQRSRIT